MISGVLNMGKVLRMGPYLSKQSMLMRRAPHPYSALTENQCLFVLI